MDAREEILQEVSRGKDPARMSAGQINKELDGLDKASSKLTDRFIKVGRGSERFSDIAKQSDPMSLKMLAIADRQDKLRQEITKRMGPGLHSRLPAGLRNSNRALRKMGLLPRGEETLDDEAVLDESGLNLNQLGLVLQGMKAVEPGMKREQVLDPASLRKFSDLIGEIEHFLSGVAEDMNDADVDWAGGRGRYANSSRTDSLIACAPTQSDR